MPQQVDDPPYLTVGTEVSAKYKGAFCEAKVRKVVRNIKCKVAYKQQGLGSGVVSDDQIKGALRVGAMVEVKHPERKEYVEATLTKIQDCSQYTVVFDDGDITTLRRSALCLKSGRHFNESETLDQLPLTHPEHFGNPVIGGRRGRRSRHLLADDSSDEDDEPATHSRSNTSDKEENIGKVICVETSDNKKKNPKENWFPGLVVAPTAQDTVRIRVKDEYLVRSFKDGRYYTVPKKEAAEFTRDSVNKSEAAAVSAAIEYMDSDVLPPHWDREALFGMAGSCSDSDQELETDSSDDEPTEEKDHFVAQLYKFMDDRGTPLNKVPSIINRDVNLYRLFRAVQKLHGYNRVTSQNQWKQIALRLGFSPATASITNLVKQAYKKFLFSFEEFNRKLGCTMVPHPKTSRSKGRSLVRASSVQSPKLPEKEKLLTARERAAAAAASNAALSSAADATNSAVDESGNTSESSAAESTALRPAASKRKVVGGGKVKALVDKFEEKEKEREKEKTPSSKAPTTTSAGDSSSSGGNSGSGGRKDDGTPSSTTVTTPVSAKKDKLIGRGKPSSDTVERRGRKRKDADSLDSKKDDREGSAGAGGSGGSGNTGTGGSVKQEKQTSQGSGPHGGSGSGNSSDRGSGNGSGPGAGGGRRQSVSPASGTVPDFPIEVGDKLKVYYDEQKVTYEAKVIEIANQEGNPIYLVHYTGWNTRYDEWVRKERIAENLTNSKQTKKGKSSSNTPSTSAKASSSTVASTPGSGDPKTPKVGKRSRGNSKGDGPGTTPRSTTPNVGRTKSPATQSNRRPLTRGGSSAATGSGSLSAAAAASSSSSTAGRRTSNNTDISSSLSVPTDPDNTSDTDSDEPMMKKCTTNSSSSTTSSNSSISMSSTSTKVSTTAEAGSSSDAAAISDEFSNGATKGGAGGGGVGGVGGRDYDLNQIRSELKGFKELKSPGSPASDTTTTTTTTTTTAAGDGLGPSSTTNPSDIPKHIILKREPTAAGIIALPSAVSEGSLGDAGDAKAAATTTTITVVKKEHTPVVVKEEESTVTEEEEEPEKSSESETLSEEDSSQSSNKAFSSSPITTMVDSDTAETPLLATAIVPTPKVSPDAAARDDSSSAEPLATTAASEAKLSGVVKKELAEVPETGGEKQSPSVAGGSKPPIKTYGTAATIIANSEKMAFCCLRDVTPEGDVKPGASGSSATQKEPTADTVPKMGTNTSPTVSQSVVATPQTPSSSWAVKREMPEQKSSPPSSNLTAASRSTTTTAPSTPGKASSTFSAIKEEQVSPIQSVITGGTGKAIKSPKSPMVTPVATTSDDTSLTAPTVKGSSSALTSPSTSVVSVCSTVTPTPTTLSTSSAFGMLRAERKQPNPGPTAPMGGEKKITLGREGLSAFSSTTTSTPTGGGTAPASTLKHGATTGGLLLGEKKHFSSSTLTPAQNKLLSKEALSIKSIFESTANRMDEKISDIYEFEDEYDDHEIGGGGVTGSGGGAGGGVGGVSVGTSGVPRKLVSDVPPAEVVTASSSSVGGQTLEDKRKKVMQRKPLTDPLDATSSVGGGPKRAKKVSPMKSQEGTADSKPLRFSGMIRRDTQAKEKDEQTKEKQVVSAGDSGSDTSSTKLPTVGEKVSTARLASVSASPSAASSSTTLAASATPLSTPIKSDSTFDVLRKSPSFNLVTTPGSKEESSKSMDESEPKPPPLITATAPGVFTPVISTASLAAAAAAGTGGDRSSSMLHGSGHAIGPSSSVLLAMAGDGDKVKEEPTLENCKKYFNDMNFEFDAPTVKKPPSIADKVLKALSQQQQQQQQQAQQTVKSEKLDFPKYITSAMHHHPINKPIPTTMATALGSSSVSLASGTTDGSTSTGGAPSTLGTEQPGSASGVSSSSVSFALLKQSPNIGNDPSHAGKTPESPNVPATIKRDVLVTPLKTPVKSPFPSMGLERKLVESNAAPPQPTTASSQGQQQGPLLQSSPSATTGGHKHLLEQIPPARSNDLTESIRKLDPDTGFIHDDESTDSNDSEHRLIIEDAESQGSGDPVGMVPMSVAASSSSSSATQAATVVHGSSAVVTAGTTAVIVHYDTSKPIVSSSPASAVVVSAKKELFEDKPARSAASIAHEMASAASAAAVAAVAEKEKLVVKQEPPLVSSTMQGKEEQTKGTIMGMERKTTPVGGGGGGGGGVKQSLLETIIQMNPAPRGLGSEDCLMLKVNEQRRNAELMESSRRDQHEAVSAPDQSASVSTSVITSTGTNEAPNPSSTVQPPSVDDRTTQSNQSQQQAANNESLSLLLCEETIPGSPAPKDHDRPPPSTVGRKVYAEPPLGSAFLPPQNIQTATDLKQVPMDLEPPIVTITIGGNTTISSSSNSSSSSSNQGGGGGGGGPFGAAGGRTSGKVGSGGAESAVDTPNSSPRDSISQDETHDQESLSPNKKRRPRKPSEEPTLKRRRTANTSLQGGGYSSANNGSSSGYGRSQRGMTTNNNATDSEDNSDTVAAFHRSSSSSMLVPGVGKSGPACQYNFLVNLDPALNNNQRVAILRKKIQELRKTYNAIKAELVSIDRRRKKLRRRERENKKQAKLNSAGACNN
ncbi:hypothetical protein ZHAS_00019811 [Anopheles sinensis]|uniref:ARID domain-containing protein n=1 Tax=Anopheles sinensis TaxID=74873 RepID=A0A084WNC7_ANOSI|nr:hypothetical protein ZHAS_00019811 [Anopheles sinensis]